jgi:hypothetical protein
MNMALLTELVAASDFFKRGWFRDMRVRCSVLPQSKTLARFPMPIRTYKSRAF